MKPYRLPLREASFSFVERKSRFIGQIAPVATEDEARSFLQTIREKHREASHNVYAYRLHESGIMRHSDDGEPSGTAVLPFLNVFIKQDIYDFCAVATRYYGGIMLGAGGLTRAYSHCASGILDAAGIGEMRELTLCKIALPYSNFESIKRLLIANNAKIVLEDFSEIVTIEFSLKTEEVDFLQEIITQNSAGTIFIRREGVRNEVCSI